MTGPDFTRHTLWPGKIVLASASPRRRHLLGQLGVDLEVRPPDLEERSRPGESPEAQAERLAREKVGAIAIDSPHELVVGADTLVVVDDRVLGKPRDPADARRMLRELAGRTHHVITGVAVAHEGRVVSGHERTAVRFRPLEDPEIEAYVDSGEPLDKAGAYGAQGLGSLLIAEVHGCFYNVVGLPLVRLLELIRGLKVPQVEDRHD